MFINPLVDIDRHVRGEDPDVRIVVIPVSVGTVVVPMPVVAAVVTVPAGVIPVVVMVVVRPPRIIV